LRLRFADTDHHDERKDERHAMPWLQAERLARAEAERFEDGEVGV
jgi:hypothetical protein